MSSARKRVRDEEQARQFALFPLAKLFLEFVGDAEAVQGRNARPRTEPLLTPPTAPAPSTMLPPLRWRPGKATYPCPKCGKVLNSYNALKYHTKDSYNVCDKAKERFAEWSARQQREAEKAAKAAEKK